jgi:hypothetical protein
VVLSLVKVFSFAPCGATAVTCEASIDWSGSAFTLADSVINNIRSSEVEVRRLKSNVKAPVSQRDADWQTNSKSPRKTRWFVARA